MTDQPPPFRIGDRVTVKDNAHLGTFTVEVCEWFACARAPYWYVLCKPFALVREYGHSEKRISRSWHGPAANLQLAQQMEVA